MTIQQMTRMWRRSSPATMKTMHAKADEWVGFFFSEDCKDGQH
jgi:hypothetical protein